MTPEAVLARELSRALPPGSVSRLGVAVSGGGDSLCLLVLLADWCRQNAIALFVATIDHGLRAGSAEEAAVVGGVCATLKIPHDTLTWQGFCGRGNLQAAARQARQALLSDWALGKGLRHVCLGHTRDDQAETVLLRLARGSGVDGLSAMSAVRKDDMGLVWLRPLLSVRREALRIVLRDRGLTWAEDPSNEDLGFDRIKARKLLEDGPLPGLDVDTLAETAERMAAARRVLGRVASDTARHLLEIEGGDIVFPAAAFAALEDELRWRLLSMALCCVSSTHYRPRLKSLKAAEVQVTLGHRASLHGCLIDVRRGKLWVMRELAAVAALRTAAPGLWDGRWQVDGPSNTDQTPQIAALGERGLSLRPDWRDSGHNRVSLLSSPAIWEDGMMVSAPLLDSGSEWRVKLVWGKPTICEALLSH